MEQHSEALELITGSFSQEAPKLRLGEPVESLVVIVESYGLGPHFGVETKESQVGRDRGSGGVTEPSEFGLGIHFARIEKGLIFKRLFKRVAVFCNLESGSSRMTTNLDVAGI